MLPIVVQKYGGSSVADAGKIRQVAQRIVATKKKGYHVVAVVSAMGSSTDSLLKMAHEVSKAPQKREMDMLLTTGERMAMSLLTMAIQDLGLDAISFTGSQCGIITSDSHSRARIIDVRPIRIQDELERDRIVIVAGFQGMSYKREITTLGRGGSDTTAVALAATLNARYCEICSDVAGVYSSDPHEIDGTIPIEALSYDEMQEMGAAGAKVLNPDAIDFARSHGLKVMLTSTFKDGQGTLLLKPEEVPVHGQVRAVVLRHEEYHIHVSYDSPNTLLSLLRFLEKYDVPVIDMRMEGSERGSGFLTMNADGIEDWLSLQKNLYKEIGDAASFHANLGSISLVGAGLANSPQTLHQATTRLASQGLAWQDLLMTRDRITFRMLRPSLQKAAQTLHDDFFAPT